jgi:hypothetical protein
MSRSPDQLHDAARICRDPAVGCVTQDARSALLEVADDLDREAGTKEQAEERRARDAPLFNWTKP